MFRFFVFDVDGARILASESVYDDDGSTFYVVKEGKVYEMCKIRT